jgi:hypothetical protein
MPKIASRGLTLIALNTSIIFASSAIALQFSGVYPDSGFPLTLACAGVAVLLPFLTVSISEPDAAPEHGIDHTVASAMIQVLNFFTRDFAIAVLMTGFWASFVMLLPEAWHLSVGSGVPGCLFLILAVRAIIGVARRRA